MSPQRSDWPRWARVLTSPWLLSPVLVLALLAGAVVGYGAYTRGQPTHYTRGGAFGVAPPGTQAHAGVVTGQSPPPAGATPSHATGAKTTSVTTHGGAATPPPAQVSASTGGTSSGAVVAKASGPTLPREGAYRLAVSGSEHVKFGPFSACTNTFPAQSQLVVDRAAGETGSSYDFDQRFYPGNANKHDERHIYRYAASSVVLSYEQATVTCSGIKQSTTVSYTPAQTRVELPLRVGAGWHSRGGDSSRTEKATGSVVGTDDISVGGRSYSTFVIDTHVTMTGSESGTRDQRWWWSPALAILLRWHETLSGSRSGATYSEDVTCTVTGLP